jgi:phospholipid-translocating ATPase
LLIALSQFIPILKVGFLFTYVAPLLFVLGITLAKEAFDDVKRWKRDLDANSQKYQKLTPLGPKTIPSSSIKVGDMIIINPNQRVPADCVLLRTTEKTGASFIRTDQLDGETDWKLRRAIGPLQKLKSNEELLEFKASIYAEKPKKEIYDFLGNFTSFMDQDVCALFFFTFFLRKKLNL